MKKVIKNMLYKIKTLLPKINIAYWFILICLTFSFLFIGLGMKSAYWSNGFWSNLFAEFSGIFIGVIFTLLVVDTYYKSQKSNEYKVLIESIKLNILEFYKEFCSIYFIVFDKPEERKKLMKKHSKCSERLNYLITNNWLTISNKSLELQIYHITFSLGKILKLISILPTDFITIKELEFEFFNIEAKLKCINQSNINAMNYYKGEELENINGFIYADIRELANDLEELRKNIINKIGLDINKQSLL